MNFIETSVTLRDKLMHEMEQPRCWKDEEEELDVTDGNCEKRSPEAQQQTTEQMA